VRARVSSTHALHVTQVLLYGSNEAGRKPKLRASSSLEKPRSCTTRQQWQLLAEELCERETRCGARPHRKLVRESPFTNVERGERPCRIRSKGMSVTQKNVTGVRESIAEPPRYRNTHCVPYELPTHPWADSSLSRFGPISREPLKAFSVLDRWRHDRPIGQHDCRR
jgi:hypothetical protein